MLRARQRQEFKMFRAFWYHFNRIQVHPAYLQASKLINLLTLHSDLII